MLSCFFYSFRICFSFIFCDKRIENTHEPCDARNNKNKTSAITALEMSRTYSFTISFFSQGEKKKMFKFNEKKKTLHFLVHHRPLTLFTHFLFHYFYRHTLIDSIEIRKNENHWAKERTKKISDYLTRIYELTSFTHSSMKSRPNEVKETNEKIIIEWLNFID